MRPILLALLVMATLPAMAQTSAQQELARQADINQRIAARMDVLAGDPAAPVIGNQPGRHHHHRVLRLHLPLLQGGGAAAGSVWWLPTST